MESATFWMFFKTAMHSMKHPPPNNALRSVQYSGLLFGRHSLATPLHVCLTILSADQSSLLFSHSKHCLFSFQCFSDLPASPAHIPPLPQPRASSTLTWIIEVVSKGLSTSSFSPLQSFFHLVARWFFMIYKSVDITPLYRNNHNSLWSSE